MDLSKSKRWGDKESQFIIQELKTKTKYANTKSSSEKKKIHFIDNSRLSK